MNIKIAIAANQALRQTVTGTGKVISRKIGPNAPKDIISSKNWNFFKNGAEFFIIFTLL